MVGIVIEGSLPSLWIKVVFPDENIPVSSTFGGADQLNTGGVPPSRFPIFIYCEQLNDYCAADTVIKN